MAMEAAMKLANQLLASAQALAGITAHMRSAAEGRSLDPELSRAINVVIDSLGARTALDELSESERTIVIAFARSYLRQALELVDDPVRPSSWSHSDPIILQAQGAASAVVARLIREAGLGTTSMRVLDIGTGVAGLAIAFCQTFPDCAVVGLDPWEPSIALATRNVEDAGLQGRITLHQVTIEDYEDPTGFDLIWLPTFFIPSHALSAATRKCSKLLLPGGQLVAGVVERDGDSVSGAVDAMITVRSGGAVLQSAHAIALLSSASFVDVAEVSRTWQAPLCLVTGRRPPHVEVSDDPRGVEAGP